MSRQRAKLAFPVRRTQLAGQLVDGHEARVMTRVLILCAGVSQPDDQLDGQVNLLDTMTSRALQHGQQISLTKVLTAQTPGPTQQQRGRDHVPPPLQCGSS